MSAFGSSGAMESMPQMAVASGPVMMDSSMTANRGAAKGGSGGASEEPRLRKDFRETFLYETFLSGYARF